MSNSKLLQIKDLKISFPYGKGRVQVVRDINLEVEAGEIVGILGESGSGKTVSSTAVLRLSDGDGSVDDGEIWFCDMNLLNLSEHELEKIRGKEIAYIFQDTVAALNPYRKVGKQIQEITKVHGLDVEKEEILRVMKEIGLDNADLIYNMYPFQLSGGQCQRVNIAMAVVCRPKLIIADEPTSAIDASLRRKVLHLFKDINEKYGTAIMIITHDFDVAKFLCHRVVIMYGGLVMEEGRVQEVLENPIHPYTIELLKCVASLNEGEESLYSLEGMPPNPYQLGNQCPFYERCNDRIDLCRESIPPMVDLQGNRRARCVHAKSDRV
ncbi:oligopeptide/dipeptide ABC transporter ATP-binding protein [Anaerosolibacter carboniphilus]|uniref:Oligopeptide/dipeptide ABC transporter ATP-binding protein n=1 Tax=Anaerosolibacter carboniphilus TaxID=1417629 RepID=A0A841KXY1_9FIRM|nr:ABC transporter ATP-binding protein [Anaerosolibacter carboniphilus]MBB6215782.1 oligopeptide/dipeptide ABC transporter ATP-binding protein [Anaerosolibacter carboniphilus]